MPFTFEGNASHLGDFTARGEVVFVPVDVEDALVGEGVVVFTAANGDRLVGVTHWDVDPPDANLNSATSIHMSWRDSVKFSDGTVVANTGHFVKSRPPDLVVSAIIVVLHRLLPAVRTLRWEDSLYKRALPRRLTERPIPDVRPHFRPLP